MRPKHILLANLVLNGRTGTETHLRDHALEFLRSGHRVMVYSPVLGPLADEISGAGGEVSATLSGFSAPPEIVHGHHHLPAIQALLHFPRTPGIFVCHDAASWNARPPAFPRVIRQLAVDANCAERVARDLGIQPSEVEIVPNTVDAARFPPRDDIPARPRRALIFSGYARQIRYADAVKRACQEMGVQVDSAREVMSANAGPEKTLGRYDIVFAKARCALEAMAVGCHVVLCDEPGLGPVITPSNFANLQRWNFGVRLLTEKHTVSAIRAQLEGYDRKVIEALRDKVRSDCTVEFSARRFLAIYDDVLESFASRPPPDPAVEIKAIAAYLSSLEPIANHIRQLQLENFLTHHPNVWSLVVRFADRRPALRHRLLRLARWLGTRT